MSIVEIKDLSFSYDRHKTLEDINLKIEERDFFAVIGPNGGGKSTLLKLILGIIPVQQGTIKTFGEIPTKNLAKIGYVPQNTDVNIDFPIKVIEVVLMGHIGTKRPLFGYAKDEIMCAMGALSQVGMDKFSEKKIYELLKLLNNTITIIVVSHDISIVLEYANKIVHINKKLTYHNLNKEEKKRLNQAGHFCEVELFNILKGDNK